MTSVKPGGTNVSSKSSIAHLPNRAFRVIISGCGVGA
jgi:hypothetical protein